MAARTFTVLVPAVLVLTGCVGKIVTTAITAPIKVASKTADVLTTSQDEADRNRGRRERKAEERARGD